jgi:hypothetical protein
MFNLVNPTPVKKKVVRKKGRQQNMKKGKLKKGTKPFLLL